MWQNWSILFDRRTVLGLALAIVVLGTAQAWGLFSRIDRTLYLSVRAFASTPKPAPLVVALDHRLFERWGPPPWSLDSWQTLANILQQQGAEKVYLIQSTERLIRCDTPIEAAVQTLPVERGHILLPSMVRLSGQPLGHSTLCDPKLSGPFQRVPGSIGLHMDGGQLMLGTYENPSLLCDWIGVCPKDTAFGVLVQKPDAGIPMVSAAALLNGEVRIDHASETFRPVFLGVTVPGYVQWLPLGNNPMPAPLVLALSAGVARGRSEGPSQRMKPAWAFLCIALLAMLSLILRARQLWSLQVHLFVGTLTLPVLLLVIQALSAWALPVTALLLSALYAPMMTLWRRRQSFQDLMRHLAFWHQTEAFRFAPQANRIVSEKDLIRKLGWFSRSFFECPRCAFYRYEPRTASFVYAGGYDLRPADLSVKEGSATSGIFARALQHQPSGIIDTGFLKSGTGARIVPIIIGGKPHGIWVLAFRRDVEPPEAKKIAAVIDWLALRLPKDKGLRRSSAASFGFGAEVDQVKALLKDASHERLHHETLVYALPVPLLVTDISGAVVSMNRALSRILFENGLGVFTSIRELLFRLADEEQATSMANALFFARHSVAFMWSGPDERTFRIEMQPLLHSPQKGMPEMLGFTATFVDITVGEDIKMLQNRAFEAGSSDANDLVSMALKRARRDVEHKATFDVQLSQKPVPVDLDALGAVEHLSRILTQIPQTTDPGGIVAVRVHQPRDDVLLDMVWPSLQIRRDVLERANAAASLDAPQELPSLLVACVQAKKVFPHLHVQRVPNAHMRIRIEF